MRWIAITGLISNLFFHSAKGADLITDLNPGPAGSFPSNITAFASNYFFSAYTLDTGRELFRYDGTNISLVFDINETKDDLTGGIFEGNDSLPAWLTPFNGSLYFAAYDPRRGAELWRLNGATPQRAADINPDLNDTIKLSPNSSWPTELTVFNNALYFSANNSATRTNYELWKYDGAVASMVTNIHSDVGTNYSSYPNQLHVFNGSLFFMADNGTNGYELWRHDGTSAILTDINPGDAASSSYPKGFTEFNNSLLFVAVRDDVGYELFKTDGTNVTLAANIYPGPLSSYPEFLTLFQGALYLRASDGTTGSELWKYDGQSATLAADINPFGDSYPKNLTVFGSALLFAATDGVNGWELWKYNGAQAQMITNLNTAGDAFPESLTILDGKVYFSATTPETGYELFVYDGTNVTLAADINPGPGDSFPQHLQAFNGRLFFRAANDGVSNWEPWTLSPSITVPPQITPEIRSVEKLGDQTRLTWTASGGSTNIVQAASQVTGPFENLSQPLVAPGSGETTLQFSDTISTNSPAARFYIIKRL